MKIQIRIQIRKNLQGIILIFLCIPIILLFTSCSPPNEKAHPAFQKGEKALAKKQYQKAADAYQEYLCFNRRSAITHRKLAKLYGEDLDNPFLSAYHFREYLKYEPTSSDKEAIEAWIIAAEKRFARQIQEKYPEDFTSAAEIEKLKDDRRRLINYAIQIKKQNAELLKKQQQMVYNRNSSGTVVVADGMQEVYTVQPGDNLQKISRSVYGTSKYYKLIFDANRDTMKSESQLSIGQKLQIPKISRVSEQALQGEKNKQYTIDTMETTTDYPSE